MVSGSHDFFEVFFYLIPAVNMGNGQSRKADDRIHRRADVVRHIGKKYAFCFACAVRLQKSVFEQALLFHFAADFRIYAAQSQDNSVAVVKRSRIDEFHLVIFHFAVFLRPVVYVVQFFFFEFFLKLFFVYGLLKHFAVVFIYKLLHIKLDAFV